MSRESLIFFLPVYFGDVFALSSLTVTLLSLFKGDDGEFSDDEIGTACEFEGELLSHCVDVTGLFGMIGDDVSS